MCVQVSYVELHLQEQAREQMRRNLPLAVLSAPLVALLLKQAPSLATIRSRKASLAIQVLRAGEVWVDGSERDNAARTRLVDKKLLE
jgi:hypothetical protein